MRRFFLFVPILVVILIFSPPQNVEAASSVSQGDGSVCIYRPNTIYLDDCLQVEAAIYQMRMDSQTGSVAISPLPSRPPDPALSNIPYYYARVMRENAPLFTSLDDAVAGQPVYRRLETGFDYITYIDLARVDGKRYFMIDPGVWLPGDGVSPVATPTFQGLEFTSTPRNDFGWVLVELETKQTPEYTQVDPTGNVYYRYDIVQIRGSQKIDGIEWMQIGESEWIEATKVARVSLDVAPPEGVPGDRWVSVNLKEQTLAVYDDSELVFAALVSTGVPGAWTQPGVFQIYLKKEAETMSGAFTVDRSDYYYLEDVPWTMYFDQARALHGTYWHNGYGVPRSRGCVNLSPGDARWIYDWADEGDWVYVWDPSGQTPTDPDLYGAGGA